jgi:hypothetical protein
MTMCRLAISVVLLLGAARPLPAQDVTLAAVLERLHHYLSIASRAGNCRHPAVAASNQLQC